MLLWLWCRPVAMALIRPLAWEPPYASGATLEKKQTNEKTPNFILSVRTSETMTSQGTKREKKKKKKVEAQP